MTPDPDRPTSKGPSPFASLYLVTQFSWQVVASIFLGMVIDHFLDTGPWGTLILSLLGLVAAVIGLISTGLRALRKDQR